MSIILTGMMSLVIFVVCPGILQFTFAENRLRKMTLHKEPCCDSSCEQLSEGSCNELCNDGQSDNPFCQAVKTCQKESGSLFTVFDEKDMSVIYNFMQNHDRERVWLGLRKTSNYSATWSNGSSLMFSETKVNVSDGEQKCDAIKNGTWTSFNCSERKYFMCQNSTGYYPVREEKNWCQALQYCRDHFTDLASINDEEQNEQAKNKSQRGTFWIGLMHDQWEWEDRSCSTFRAFKNSSPVKGNCASFNPTADNDGKMEIVNCAPGKKHKGTLCSDGTVRIQIVDHKNVTWEEALGYCEAHHSRLLWIADDQDQTAVSQWLENSPDFPSEFWIGLRQSTVFGFWIWHDRIVNLNHWRDGKPPDLLLSKHCGVISRSDSKWSAEDCRYELPFICEEDVVEKD